MIKKQQDTFTFADAWLCHMEKEWESHWLKKIQELLNWNKFSYRLNKLYTLDNGRPGWDPMILFRCVILSEWFGMSDEALEEAMKFRVDFRKFVGLNWEDSAPDAMTYCVFRKRIRPIMDKLLKILNEQRLRNPLSVNSKIIRL